MKEMINKNHKNYDIFDLTKFILSIMIVAIHTQLFPKVLYPWLRIAVPMFFIISSYFLCNKIKNSPDCDKWEIVGYYIKRILKLYLFWFVVLLPITVFVRRDWFSNGFVRGIINMVSNTMFSSTFVASWYLTATIIATPIVLKLSEKINRVILGCIFVGIYIICTIVSSYGFIFDNVLWIKEFFNYYKIIFTSPVNSFPVALIWIYIGKLFSDNDIKLVNFKNKTFFIILLVSGLFLYAEWRFVWYLTDKIANDCYLLLVPFTFSLFAILKNINIELKCAKILRTISNITYPLHASIVIVIDIISCHLFKNTTIIGIFNFCVTIILVYIICFIIMKLEDKKCFRFLKNSH